MSHKIVFRKSARADLREAQRQYEEQQRGLGRRFAQEIDETMKRIQINPTGYRVAYHDVREKTVRKFPYVIYYRVVSNRILVLAVLHGRRDPEVWRARIDNED